MSRVLRIALVGMAILAVALASGCGSEDGFPPAAEPGVAPEVNGSAGLPGTVFEVGGEAEGIVADERTGLVSVALRDPDQLVIFRGASGKIIRRVKLGESARHLQLAGPGGPVLATAERTDELIEIPLDGGKTRSTLVGDFPHDASQFGDRTYVGDEGGDTISVVEDGNVIETVPAPEQPGGIATVGRGRPLIGVIAVAERVLELFDPETLDSVAKLDAGVGPTHLVKGPGDLIYVADTQGDAILIFETAPEPRLVDRVNVPFKPYGIAFDAINQRLWVTQTERNAVIGFTTEDRVAPKALFNLATVQQAGSVAVDGRSGRLFVASRSDGVVQRIDADEYLGDE